MGVPVVIGTTGWDAEFERALEILRAADKPLFLVLLGIVQGLTELLPVSSSAHLILARAFFGWNAEDYGLAFDVAAHVGTLLAIGINRYFRSAIVEAYSLAPAIIPDLALAIGLLALFPSAAPIMTLPDAEIEP